MGRNAEAIVILFMFAGAAVAAAQAPPPSVLQCGAKCALQCMRPRFPPLVALCFGLCMITCKNSPPRPVYNCTYACAKTMFTNSMSINSNKLAVESVSDFVESCYKSCSKE